MTAFRVTDRAGSDVTGIATTGRREGRATLNGVKT
jgi:hypothetical protein